jgi:hypothetical protein
MEIILNELPYSDLKDNEWKYKENPIIFNKYNQLSSLLIKKDEIKKDEIKKDEIKKDEIKKDEIKKDEIKKDEIKKDNKPLELIMTYTSTTEMMKGVIKDKLIEFITVPEFSKAFGMKKSSEIVSAITRNAWNQSMALFISFLLDATVIYKDKEYIYNKNKINNEISIY